MAGPALATQEKKPSRTVAQPVLLRCSAGHTGSACAGGAGPREDGQMLRRQADGGSRTEQGVPPIMQQVPNSGGTPLDAGTRAFMEPRFGQDFSTVRVHTDVRASESARAVHAHAFTAGHDVVFASGQYAPRTDAGRRLLAHELTHVVQQERGGAAPQLDAGAPQEREADAASRSLTSGAGAISVGEATGVGMARSVDDWLQSTPDLAHWEYRQLLSEISELQQWLDRQIEGTPETDRIQEALGLLQAQVSGRAKTGLAPQKQPRKVAASGAKRKGKQQEPAPIETETLALPHVLSERRTIVYEDPEEIGREFDLDMAWLQRRDLAPADRKILQAEVQDLAPQVGQTLHQEAVQRRQATIAQALTPSAGGDARIQLLDALRMVDSIKPVGGGSDQYYLMHGKELITLTQEEATSIRTRTVVELDKAALRIKDINKEAWHDINFQASVDREYLVTSFLTTRLTDKTTWEVLDEVQPIVQASNQAIGRYNAARAKGDLIAMANEIATAEEKAVSGYLIVAEHVTDIQTTGAKIVAGLEITKTVAFTIVLIASAGAAAPAIGAGVAGAEFTGLAATGLTTLGTATAIGTEGFVLGGGSAMLGEGVAGHSWEQATAAGLEEGKRWGETGAKIGAAAGLAPAFGKAFGANAPGLSRGEQFVRSGLAGGTTNLGVEAAGQAAFEHKLIDPRSGGASFAGGFLGSGLGKFAGDIENPVVRTVAQVGVGGVSSGGATFVATGDVNKSLESAAIGGVTSLALSRAPEPSKELQQKAFERGQAIRRDVLDPAVRFGKNSLAAAMIATRLAVPPAGITGGGVSFSGRTPAALVQSGGTTPTLGEPFVTGAVHDPEAEFAASIDRAFADTPAQNAPGHVAPAANPADLTQVQAQRIAQGLDAVKDIPALQETVRTSNVTIGDERTTLRDLTADNPQLVRELWIRWQQGRADQSIETADFGAYVRIRQREFRGAGGELTEAFRRGPNEVFVKAPKSVVTEPGSDMITAHLSAGPGGPIKLLDNKAVRGGVAKVSALEQNLPKNLADDIAEVQAYANQPGVPSAIAADVLPRLQAAKRDIDAHVAANPSIPLDSPQMQQAFTQILSRYNIQRVVTTSGGGANATISTGLRNKGFTQE